VDRTELDLIRQLRYASFSEEELVDIFHEYAHSYRLRFHLVQHPRFPAKLSLGVIARLFVPDLLRVIKNKRTNPFVRKRAELEFTVRYQKISLGEKISLMRIAPHSLLAYFTEEKDARILKVIFNNENCTEDLVLRFILRRGDRQPVYELLADSHWYKRPNIASAISRDAGAPIKLLLKVIPYLRIDGLRDLYQNDNTHQIVKDHIITHMQSRNRP
jgi:hypothetical protein